jgi:hypothetical protein
VFALFMAGRKRGDDGDTDPSIFFYKLAPFGVD